MGAHGDDDRLVYHVVVLGNRRILGTMWVRENYLHIRSSLDLICEKEASETLHVRGDHESVVLAQNLHDDCNRHIRKRISVFVLGVKENG